MIAHWVIAGLLLFGLSAVAAERQPASVRMYCLSLRFQPSTTTLAGQTFTIELTTDESFAEINGELTPLFRDDAPTHAAFFRMRNSSAPGPINGHIAFDEPNPVDTNKNGFHDFYEVALPVSDTSFGLFATQVARGNVKASWSREAGSPIGTCRLQLTSTEFGPLPEFVHSFELIEYTGTLLASSGTNTITASLSVKQTGKETNTLSAALAFTRSLTNRFDELRLLPGSFLSSRGDVFLHNGGFVERDTKSKTNYFGFMDFADGDLTTRIEDYYDWVVSIDDPNDSNGNTIPDLSDDVTTGGGSSTLNLGVSVAAGQLLLSIRGELGKVYSLEQTVSLQPPQWTQTTSITLTNNPQVLSFEIPQSPTLFWRVREPRATSGPQL